MNRSTTTLALGALAILSTAGAALLPCQAAAAMPVFDATNYAQNLLQAARALEQVNHQIQSLQNEAEMLKTMARNLERIDFPQLQKIKEAMRRIDGLMDTAKGIDFRVDALDDRVRSLFPGTLDSVLKRDQRVVQARAQLDAAIQSYRQTMAVQAEVARNVREDAGTLAELVGRSQDAVGGLQAQQAANQLVALGIKQQLQLQSLMASEFRGAAIDRARRAQSEAEGRAATRRFIGRGAAYRRDR